MPPFRPGQSGNPRGRPRGSRNLATQLSAELNSTDSVAQISKLEAIIKAMVEKAQSGDSRATQMVLDRLDRMEKTLNGPRESDFPFTEADREVMTEIHRRLTQSTPPAELQTFEREAD